MTPDSFLRDVAAFWVQVACIVTVVGVLLKVVPVPARARYVCLRLALLVCLVMPWVLQSTIVVPMPAAAAAVPATDTLHLNAGNADQHQSAAPVPRRPRLPEIPWTTFAVFALLTGIAARGSWLAVGVFRLRRLTRRAVPIESAEYAAAQQQLGTSAAIAQVDGLSQPVTFGFRRPVVLLPDALADAPAGLRRAVVVHELFHVRRRDWLAVLGEEAIKTVLWFHPAILWLTSRIQLVREELVDELTVQATGDRRAYVQALLAFADTGGPRPLDWARGKPAPAFAHRRQLFHRILSVSKEKVMSVPRVVMSIGLLVAGVCGASWYAATLFPIVAAVQLDVRPTEAELRDGAGEQRVRISTLTSPEVTQVAPKSGTAGPAVLLLGQQAGNTVVQQVTPENPIPRRTRGAAPVWPSQFAGRDLQVVINARVTVDRNGAVTSVDRDGCSMRTPDESVCGAFSDATVTAIRQWRYDRPAQAPLQFAVAVRFPTGEEPAVVQSMDVRMEEWLRDVRETQESLRILAQQTARMDALTARSRELERALRLALEQTTPQHPDVAQAQAKLAQLSAELARARQQLQLASQAAPVEEERARLLEMLRALGERLESQRQSTAPQSGGNASSTVSPTPTTPFDGSPRLVSPSGRAPIRIGGTGVDRGPVPTKRVQPAYTAEAMRARVEGTVALEVLVDERGRVADARVLKSIPLLDESALAAAKQWEFTPTMLNGQPVPVLVMLELEFTLRK